MVVLFPAADLVDPVYPTGTADFPVGIAVTDPALGTGPVAACWLGWEAAGESDEAAMVSVGVDQVDCVKS